LVGSDLLYGKYHLNSLLCRDGIHGGE
jgi:hypothetical protein